MKTMILQSSTLIAALFLLSGCASTPKNIPLSDDFWKTHSQNIVVAKTKAPVATLSEQGPIGLADYAIISAVNSGFNHYMKSMDVSWYSSLQQQFAKELNTRNIKAIVYTTDTANKVNYKQIAAVTNSDNVLSIHLIGFGAVRDYYAMAPTDNPTAYCHLEGKLINAATGQVLWSYDVMAKEPVQGEWKQPPSYPNFTAALQKAENSASSELVDSFFSGH